MILTLIKRTVDMIRFEYDNNEAKKLILEFRCKNCSKLTKTELLHVPEMDLDNYTTTKKSYRHECPCNACYSIEIYNGLYDSYGIIQGIEGEENNIMVHEVPDIPYNKDTVLADTINAYSRISSIVNGIEGLSKEDKNYIYCILFSNLISILDSFIKIYTEPIVLRNNNLIEKFSVTFGMPKGKTEEKIKKISSFYKQRSFQSVTNQNKLFKDVFNVDIEIDDRIAKYVAIRDIIIHRNAIDAKGYIHKITKSQLLQALEVILKYIQQIFNSLINFEADLFVEKMNR